MSARGVLIITFWPYKDALVKAYVLPNIKEIRRVIGISPPIVLVTLERENLANETILISEDSKVLNYKIRYRRFGFRAVFTWCYEIFKLFLFCRRAEISVVHAWCTPAGSVGYLLSLLLGVPLILDSYEPHADAMLECGVWRKWGLAFNVLFLFEKRQTLRATHIIAASENMLCYSKTRYAFCGDSFFVKPASVDLKKFNICTDKKRGRSFLGLPPGMIFLYAGKFGGMYYGEEVFRLVAYLKLYHFPEMSFVVLTNTPKEVLNVWCKKYSFPQQNLISKFVDHSMIADYLSVADLGLTPVKPVPSKLCCSPLKNAEYFASGVPVLISPNISTDSDAIVKNNLGVICHFDSPATYEKTGLQLRLLLQQESSSSLQRRVRSYAVNRASSIISSQIYDQVYTSLGFQVHDNVNNIKNSF
jgi:hypothetical protein